MIKIEIKAEPNFATSKNTNWEFFENLIKEELSDILIMKNGKEKYKILDIIKVKVI